MNPADICTTLRLPTLVDPRSPTFSLHLLKAISLVTTRREAAIHEQCTYTETVEPVPVPKSPSNRMPMP